MINVDKKEVLRYLGYKNQELPEYLSDKIDKIIEDTKKHITPRHTYRVYYIEPEDDCIRIIDTDTRLYGNDIYKLLQNCSRCIFLAATLGIDIEKRIITKQLSSVNDAYIMDASATAFIEAYCDAIEVEIMNELRINDCYMTNRYSPGYGDFNIELQPAFLELVDANISIGLYSTRTNILTPRKSVTAIIGILDNTTENNIKAKNKCDNCKNKERCIYRKKDE